MKASFFMRSRMLLTVAAATIAFASCTKDNADTNPSGTASVMVVNSAEGSAPQNFYLDNSQVNATAVAYAQNSGYISATPGSNRKAEFRTAGTGSVNASFNMTVENNKFYTVYLTGSGSSTSSVSTEDDMTLPPSGKAKIRFVHLSQAAATTIDIGVNSATKIVSGLAYKAASAYSVVDANSSFQLYAAGSSTVVLNIPTTIQAGKIYTVYVSGATTATISYHLIVQN